MPVSANHEIPTPSSDEPPVVPDHLVAMADQIDSELDAIAPGQIVGVSAGRLLATSSTGAVTSRAVSGDATISGTGELSIGGGKVNTAELKDSSVTAAKVGNGAVTLPKLASWFQPSRVVASGTFSSFGYVYYSHDLGHTNYTALVTPSEGANLMTTSWFKGTYTGYNQNSWLTIVFNLEGSGSVSNPSFSVLLFNLA